jgi:hypothetical protein
MHTTFSTATALQPLTWLLDAFDGVTAAPPVVDRARHLRRGETMVVEQPLGQAVICTEGWLWITHDREPEDHMVQHGERYVAAHRERMLVHALSDATVRLVNLQR